LLRPPFVLDPSAMPLGLAAWPAADAERAATRRAATAAMVLVEDTGVIVAGAGEGAAVEKEDSGGFT